MLILPQELVYVTTHECLVEMHATLISSRIQKGRDGVISQILGRRKVMEREGDDVQLN